MASPQKGDRKRNRELPCQPSTTCNVTCHLSSMARRADKGYCVQMRARAACQPTLARVKSMHEQSRRGKSLRCKEPALLLPVEWQRCCQICAATSAVTCGTWGKVAASSAASCIQLISLSSIVKTWLREDNALHASPQGQATEYMCDANAGTGPSR